MRVILIVLCVTALAGCGGGPQRNAAGYTSEQQAYYDFFISQGLSKETANLAAVSPVARQLYFDDRKCQSYGAKPGSDAYVACRAQLEAGHDKPPPVIVRSQSPATNCTSIPLGGGMVSTNCY